MVAEMVDSRAAKAQRSQTPSSIWQLMINVNADTPHGQPIVEGGRDEISSPGKEDLGGKNLALLFCVRLVGFGGKHDIIPKSPFQVTLFRNSRDCFMEKAMAPHSSTLAWKIPWTEEPGGPQFVGLLRVGHD